MHRLVIDTNVFVSSILGKSFPHFIVHNLVLTELVVIVISGEVLIEYHEVFTSKKFDKHLNFRSEALELISKLKRVSSLISPLVHFNILNDKDDNKFLDLAYAGNADFLITGKLQTFPLWEI